MFQCSNCKRSSKPRTSPTFVPTELRHVEYSNQAYDPIEDTNFTKITSGTEFFAELSLCQECAGLKPASESHADLSVQIALGLTVQSHGKKCRELLAECKTCQRNLRIAQSLPLGAVAAISTEPLAKNARFRLITIALDNLMTRTTDQSKRATADFAAGFGLIKGYESRGGGL